MQLGQSVVGVAAERTPGRYRRPELGHATRRTTKTVPESLRGSRYVQSSRWITPREWGARRMYSVHAVGTGYADKRGKWTRARNGAAL